MTQNGAKSLEGVVSPERLHKVNTNSVRRLLLDIPLAVRRLRPASCLFHYTAPVRQAVPIVLLVHDCSFMYDSAKEWIPPHSLMRYRLSIARSIRQASVLLAPTEYVRQDLGRLFSAARNKPVLLAPNAVSFALAEALGHISPRKPSFDERTKKILFVGNPLPRKNLETLTAAVRTLNAAGPGQYEVTVVGTVDHRGRPAFQAAQRMLGSALVATGWVSDLALADLYAGADVLAVPSMNEGFGIPVLEAMQAGLPVVSSDATCLPEVAGGAALLAPARDVASWVAALEQACNNRGYWSQAGRARAATFSWYTTSETVRTAMSMAAVSKGPRTLRGRWGRNAGS